MPAGQRHRDGDGDRDDGQPMSYQREIVAERMRLAIGAPEDDA
jgi:hypothetical protein